jgi:hypothetical protein
VLFFNAFELGAVILKDAHISAEKELGAREHKKNYETLLSLNHFL